jgi:flagellar basal body-associated protein FliL
MWQILLNILIVLVAAVALVAGCTFFVWVLVRLAPMTETEEKPPPPRSAVE